MGTNTASGQYAVKRGKVYWGCAGCGEPLVAPLADAGTGDRCPKCGAGFVVPGTREKEVEAIRREADEAVKRQRENERADEHRQQVEAAREATVRYQRQADERSRRTPLTSGLAIMGVLAVVAGILLIFAGIVTDTTVSTGSGSVHNIGLLARRVVLLLTGTGTFLAGFLMVGLGKLGAEVNRWGHSLLLRLETDLPKLRRAESDRAAADDRAPEGD